MNETRASCAFLLALFVFTFRSTASVEAGVVFRSQFNSQEYLWRWDAAPRTISSTVGMVTEMRERSLDGGLRYSLEGGSYQAFRDMFSWQGSTPSTAEFTAAVERAFDVWTASDPVSGLGTSISFTPDLNTPVDFATHGNLRLGAEIDVFAADDIGSGTAGRADVSALGLTVELTSGVPNYDSFVISGADIRISNLNATYTLDGFENLLRHEIGHALGLADAEQSDFDPPQFSLVGTFLDDNYDATSSSSALATLTNSWAAKVNPLDPDNLSGTGLSLYRVGDDAAGAYPGTGGDPGLDTPGVNFLMESEGSTALIGVADPLSNDDFGTRQYLYPAAIPEPNAAIFLLVSVAMMLWWKKEAKSK